MQGPWLELARKEADAMLAAEPELETPAHAPIKREVKLRFPQLIETA